ncbi:MAG: deoxyribose-phosphate aldolase [Elusimicrobia bacterium]|nr:deoxyribose-phosphate aldolase [Elusimicrobiota bacterium]
MKKIRPQDLAHFIDYTLLKADASQNQIKTICKQADKFGFKSVCVNPCWVKFCAKLLKNSLVKVCTVIGFPLGTSATKVKVFEAKEAIKDGADELDAVINIGKIKSNDYEYATKEIRYLRRISKGKILKIILETSYLNRNEIMKLCKITKKAGVDFVKTSTGFSSKGASIKAVKLMKKTVGNYPGIKASGGIAKYCEAIKMILAGATRIGTSRAIQIISGK